MESRRYPTDLADEKWRLLESHLPSPKRRGHPRIHSPREILNAVFYVLKSGCQWRMLPRDFPPWKTVFHYFRAWRLDGTWEKMNRAMQRRLRKELGRDPEPSAGIVDAQSAKTTGMGGEQRGFDGGKKVRGRKRHPIRQRCRGCRGVSRSRRSPSTRGPIQLLRIPLYISIEGV